MDDRKNAVGFRLWIRCHRLWHWDCCQSRPQFKLLDTKGRLGSGIDVSEGETFMGQIFDFSEIKKSEKTIRKTWSEFRDALAKNQDFFSMLLSNDEMKHQVMGIFSDEIYTSLRESV